MRTVHITKRSKSINLLLQEARRQNVIIRASDGHEFILAEVDDFSRETALTRHNKQLMAFLNQRARQSKTVPLHEAKKLLGLG